jgi:hypothetical protein
MWLHDKKSRMQIYSLNCNVFGYEKNDAGLHINKKDNFVFHLRTNLCGSRGKDDKKIK